MIRGCTDASNDWIMMLILRGQLHHPTATSSSESMKKNPKSFSIHQVEITKNRPIIDDLVRFDIDVWCISCLIFAGKISQFFVPWRVGRIFPHKFRPTWNWKVWFDCCKSRLLWPIQTPSKGCHLVPPFDHKGIVKPTVWYPLDGSNSG